MFERPQDGHRIATSNLYTDAGRLRFTEALKSYRIADRRDIEAAAETDHTVVNDRACFLIRNPTSPA